MRKLLLPLLLLSSATLGQTNAPPLLNAKGTTLPSSCTIGKLFFKTNATAGNNIYACGAANIWTQVVGVPAASGVTTFNTRSGAVTLSSGDVSGAGGVLADGSVQFGGASLNPYSGDPIDFTSTLVKIGQTLTATADLNLFAQRVNVTLDPVANSISAPHASSIAIGIPATNAQNFNIMYANETIAQHAGSGEINIVYGAYTDADNIGSGQINFLYGHAVDFGNYGAGTVVNAYGHSATLTKVAGTITNGFLFYGNDLAGQATNPYYAWFDSRGVFRIREDSTFDSVGQAIPALYNPQFAKYTPGAANYERVVLGQWNGNVAEIGTEKGGTGTLRPLRLLGASVSAQNGSGTPVSVTASDFIVGSTSIKSIRCVSASASGGLTIGVSNKVTATCTGATNGMVTSCSPTTYPGDGVIWNCYVSAADTVTVVETGLAVVTPTATTFQVSVTP